MAKREITLDFVAIIITGIVLATLLVLSMGVNLWALSERRDEHEQIHDHITRIEHKLEELHP